MKRFLIIVICVMLVAFALAAVLWAAGGQGFHLGDWNNGRWDNVNFDIGPGGRFSTEIDQSGECDLTDAAKVRIETVSSAIHVYPSDEDTISADLKGTFASNRKNVSPTLIVERRGDTVVVEVRYPQLSGVSINANMDLTVNLPASFAGSLTLDTVSGSPEVFMPLTLDAFTFDSVSGDIDISDVTAETVNLSTTSGRVGIEVTGCDRFKFDSVSGDLSAVTDAASAAASTTSGRIELDGLTGSLKATSVSGAIRASFTSLGDVRADNVSGSVTLDVPEGSGFNLDYGTASGGFDCDFPITLTESGPMRTKGTVGEGGPAISVQTVSGGLNIQ